MLRPFASLMLAAALSVGAANAQTAVSELPAALLDKIRADVAKAQGVSAGDVKVVSTEAVNWPNGALGCPKPGMMYTQAIVPGYRIEVEAAGHRLTYHASAKGSFKRCDRRIGPMTPRSTR